MQLNYVFSKKFKNIIFLCIIFIFSFQIFYYFSDFLYLYIPAKIFFPLLAILFGFIYILYYLKKKKVDANAILFLLFWFILSLSSGAMSNYYFEQSFIVGFVSQIKLAAFSFYFLLLYVLIKYKVTFKELEEAFIILAVSSLLLFYFMNLFIDPHLFWNGEFNNIIFPGKHSSDEIRYVFPIVFVHIGIFIYFRKYLVEKKYKFLIYVFAGVFYEIFFHEQRMEMAALILTLILSYTWHKLSPKSAFFLSIIGIIIGLQLILWSFSEIKMYFIQDSSFAIRLNTLSVVFLAFENDVLGWIFGHGFLSPIGQKTYQDLYGDNFWLADIGWIGVIYEFGIIGVLIFMYVYYLIFSLLNRLLSLQKLPLILAFRDYVLMSIIFSPLATLVLYRLGVFISMIAILSYLIKYYENIKKSEFKNTD